MSDEDTKKALQRAIVNCYRQVVKDDETKLNLWLDLLSDALKLEEKLKNRSIGFCAIKDVPEEHFGMSEEEYRKCSNTALEKAIKSIGSGKPIIKESSLNYMENIEFSDIYKKRAAEAAKDFEKSQQFYEELRKRVNG